MKGSKCAQGTDLHRCGKTVGVSCVFNLRTAYYFRLSKTGRMIPYCAAPRQVRRFRRRLRRPCALRRCPHRLPRQPSPCTRRRFSVEPPPLPCGASMRMHGNPPLATSTTRLCIANTRANHGANAPNNARATITQFCP